MNVPLEPDDLPLAEARRLFFLASGLGDDGGYTNTFYWLGWKWLRLPVPNTSGRRQAVRLHDLHHVATGYGTTWRGEAEIGAWELGGGCGRYWAAWILNFLALTVGLFIAPGALWPAFLRGRRCRNLYHGGDTEGELLRQSVGQLRLRLGLPWKPGRPTFADRVAFGGTVAASCVLIALGGAAAGLACKIGWSSF